MPKDIVARVFCVVLAFFLVRHGAWALRGGSIGVPGRAPAEGARARAVGVCLVFTAAVLLLLAWNGLE